MPQERSAGEEQNHEDGPSTPVVESAVWDADLRCELINPILAAMSGIPPDLHLGKSPRDIRGEVAMY